MSDIEVKYLQLGGTGGFLRGAISAEISAPDGTGRYKHFQGGSIYWYPGTGAHEIHGAIRGLWASIGWERSIVGYPVTDEQRTPDGVGAFNHFQNGSIYWSPATGAHKVHGAIRNLWASLGWEQSFLGYPTSDELATEDGSGRYQEFQRGSIYWSPATGPVTVQAPVARSARSSTTFRARFGRTVVWQRPNGSPSWRRRTLFSTS